MTLWESCFISWGLGFSICNVQAVNAFLKDCFKELVRWQGWCLPNSHPCQPLAPSGRAQTSASGHPNQGWKGTSAPFVSEEQPIWLANAYQTLPHPHTHLQGLELGSKALLGSGITSGSQPVCASFSKAQMPSFQWVHGESDLLPQVLKRWQS